MKKIICTLLLVWSFIAAKANYQASSLTLSMYDNSAFSLTFDNSYFNTPASSFNINNVTPGNHYVKVVKMPPPSHNPHNHCAHPVLVYDGYINVPAASTVNAMVSGINQLSILSVIPNYGYNGYTHNSCSNPCCSGNNGYNNYNPHNGGNYGNPYGSGPTYMDGHSFNMLKSSISSKSFDSSKLTVAKQGIQGNKLASWQVAELMDLFSFESSKLEIAKFAYHYVLDPQNYYTVNDSFTFSSSITELDGYIAKN